MNLSAKIRELREQKGWSQMDTAYRLDISQAAYNKWEAGQTKPTIENLQKLSEIFEADFYSLLNELLPNIDLSNSKFEGHSYVVNPIDSTINYQYPDFLDKIFENQTVITQSQSEISRQMESQNKLIESLLKKLK
jgi:transcriptional regulator with XRE-family HTH domain